MNNTPTTYEDYIMMDRDYREYEDLMELRMNRIISKYDIMSYHVNHNKKEDTYDVLWESGI